jgi:hypothetical protein
MFAVFIEKPNCLATKIGIGFAILLLSACSTNMATKQSGFLSDYSRLSPPLKDGQKSLKTTVSIDPAHTTVTAVEWRVKNDSLSPEERAELLKALKVDLQEQLLHLPPSPNSRPAEVRAAITDISTVSPSLNVLSAALIAVPLDRGGAAVEIEAIDSGTHQQLAALSQGYYAPMSEVKARFSKLASARIAIDKVSADFGPLIHP